jgi:hypothetical protein
MKSVKLRIVTAQRVRESKPIFAFRDCAQFLRKLAALSALNALTAHLSFARFAQNYAVRVSEFLRKTC